MNNNIQKELQNEKKLVPVADIFETDDNYIINLEIPGISKENLDITLDDDKLIVKGNTSTESSEKEISYREFKSYGYERIFRIGNEVDRTKIDAKLENGILEIKLHKSEDIKPRKININEIH